MRGITIMRSGLPSTTTWSVSGVAGSLNSGTR